MLPRKALVLQPERTTIFWLRVQSKRSLYKLKHTYPIIYRKERLLTGSLAAKEAEYYDDLIIYIIAINLLVMREKRDECFIRDSKHRETNGTTRAQDEYSYYFDVF